MASSFYGGDGATYDVFLSHRGPDTKKSFSFWLKEKLEEQGITTFLDDKSLRPGDIATREMDEAMQAAKWGVIVLSPGFFASGYCMKELKVFLDRERAILIGCGLGADDCNADQIVGSLGSIWEQHGGKLWESCSAAGEEWSEEAWRNVVRRAKQTTFLQLHTFDGYWDRCIAEAVRVTAQRLGRPVVAGMGGVGKTQLALSYVYGHEREYGLVLWLDADSQSLLTSYLGLAGILGVELKEEGSSDSGGLVKEELGVGKIRGRLERLRIPCLLVLDNVDNQSELADLLPRRGPCHIIATSRLRYLVNFGAVPLDVLEKEDGLQLLKGNLALSEEEARCAERLAERFGYLTLALAVSRKLFSEGLFSPSELLTRLNAKEARVFEREPMDPVFKTHPDLIKLFQASVDMLGRDSRATTGEKLLAERMLWAGGWFAAAPIAKPLLKFAASNLSAADGVESAAPKPREEEGEELGAALGLLRSYGLATETLDGRVALHKLVQSLGKCVGPVTAGVAMVQTLVAVGQVQRDEEHFANGVDKAMPLDLETPAEIALQSKDGLLVVSRVAVPLIHHYKDLKYQLLAALALGSRCEVMLDFLQVPIGSEPRVPVFYAEAGVLKATGKYGDAETLYRQCLAIRKENGGLEHRSTASLFGMLGEVLELQGKYDEAEPLLRRAVEMTTSEFGSSHPSTAVSLSNLAGLLDTRGQHGEAEELYRSALSILWKSQEDNHLRTDCSSNLGALLHDQGKYKDAEPLLREALRIREGQLGPAHPVMAESLNNLARLLADLGKHEEAGSLYERTVGVWEKELGPTHPNTATAISNLGLSLTGLGKYANAESLHRRALAIREEELGPDHPDTAVSLTSLSDVLETVGRYDEAEPLQRRALQIFESKMGPSHPSTAAVLEKLASLLQCQGIYGEAELLYKRALDIMAQKLGSTHPTTASTLNNLAQVLVARGKLVEAGPLYTRAIEISEMIWGPDNSRTATYIGNYAVLLLIQGKHGKAEPPLRRALSIIEKEHGPAHIDTARCINNLAQVLAARDNLSEAELLSSRALAIMEIVLGPEHPDTATYLVNLAGVLGSQLQYAEAERLYRRGLEIIEKALGPIHPSMGFPLHNLAVLLVEQGQYDEAEPLLRRAVAIREKQLGPNHIDSISSLKVLTDILFVKGDHDSAEPLMRQALEAAMEVLGPDHPKTISCREGLELLLWGLWGGLP